VLISNNNTAQKTINQPVRVRGNFIVTNPNATINTSVNSLEVWGRIENAGQVNNSGVIEVGN
jgi:hypothetical protein